jgi:uncharacterized repeat protein (TIGR02543 family)
MDTDEGFGLIRRNGSKMPLYTDLQSISSEALIPEDYFVTPSDFQKLGDVTNWLEVDVDKDGDRYKELPASEIEAERYAVARGAGISNLRGDVSLPLGWKFDGKAPQISLWIPDESGPMPGVLLKYNKQVTKPLADPAGGRYTAVQNVELTSATEGAAIYYSTNGSDPRTNGIVYTGKISVTMGTTLRAYASLDGCADSDVMSEIYLEDDDVPTYYTITFNLMGGDGSVPSQRILSGGTVTSPPDPTLTGYYFAGWYSDSAFTTLWDFNTVVTGNMTLYARWTQDSYTVTFNSNLGSGVPSQSIPSGGTVTRPANPTYSGYEFDDWYRDSALTTRWDFDTVVTGDMTLYAGWLDDDQPNYGGGGGGCSAYAFSSMGVLMVLAAGTLLKKSKKAR